MTPTSALRVPVVGEEAPDFTPTATTGEPLTLAKLRGESVLGSEDWTAVTVLEPDRAITYLTGHTCRT